MVKRIFIAITLVTCLASMALAAHYEVAYYSPFYEDAGLKVDGKEKIRWVNQYEVPTLCTIPIKMRVGMFVQIRDCKKLKLVLQQVDCADIGKGSRDYPCYLGCVSIDVRANFDVKMGTGLEKTGDVIDSWEAYYDGGDVIYGDGNYHAMKVCVNAWKTRIYRATPGDEVDVGRLNITVTPDIY